ncbi:hypothetical protein PBRA_003920 [Plasmodiophora brassicae]|uniref:Fungal lipase-type domain-containing protein n=1 Tax=Plasmodiophora brassicae TaxID=37360 RepID=A0A0G4IJA0_PLABS|nr:hypothetical protein PBRA_003920 [Plasmodiophora brassicae]
MGSTCATSHEVGAQRGISESRREGRPGWYDLNLQPVGSRFVWAASSTVFAIMDDAWVRFQSRAQQLRHVLQTRSALAILHAYHVVVLDAAIAVLDAIRWFPTGQERLERILQATASFLFAGQYRTGKRESVPYALVNVVDTRFHLHQDYAARLAKEFPWVAEQASTCEIDHPHTVHFLALISKLAYESRPVISDFVARKWGLQVQFVTAGTSTGVVVSTDRAVIICFQAVTSSGRRVPTGLDGVAAELPDGKGDNLQDLFGKGAADGLTMVEALENAALREPHVRKLIVVTGHGLGGSLAALFCLMCDARIRQRIAGCVTFGQPKVCDVAFRQAVERDFTGKYVQYVYANDFFTTLPFFGVLDFRDREERRYVGGGLGDPSALDLVSLLPRRVFQALSFPARGESLLRALVRLALLPLPSVDDHLPCNYERALRDRITP